MHVVIGQSEGIDTRAVTARVLAQCEQELSGRRPDIALLYVVGEFDHQTMLDLIGERFPGVPLIGGQMGGAMCSSHGYTEDSIRLLLLSSDQLTFTAGLGRDCSRDMSAAAAQAVAMARRGQDGAENLCLTVFNVFGPDEPHELLDCLNRQLSPGCPVFGAAAAPTLVSLRGKRELTSVQYFGREVLHDGMPIALIAGPIHAAFSIENSWTPVGQRHRVNRVDGRWVERIGDRTPLELYHHYLGQHQQPAIAFPLAVFDTAPDGTELYYLRVPLTYNQDTGAVRYADPIPEGATVQLTEAIRTTMLEQSRRTVAEAMHLPDGVRPVLCMAFSCAIRKQILGTQTYRESALLTEQLERRFGDDGPEGRPSERPVPMIGVYGAREVAPLFPGQSSMLHGATLVTLVLGVRDPSGDRPVARGAVAPETDGRPSAKASGPTPTDTADPALLARRLGRANARLTKLEEHRDLNSALLRTICEEVEDQRRLIAEKNRELERLYADLACEKQKSDDLLLEILPREVAEELKRTGHVEPVYYPSASVLFADFKGFTRLAASLSPAELLRELDYFFSEFDGICDQHGLEKLKTIGDAYMCAGGIPTSTPAHARDVVAAACQMQTLMTSINDERSQRGQRLWPLRVGINTGPLMAGVIGKRKFAYDIWGNTVNIAARMESAGEPGRVNISVTTYEKIRTYFACSHRGRIPVKNAGEVDMYFVEGPLESS